MSTAVRPVVTLETRDLGVVDYRAAQELQDDLAVARKAGRGHDTLFLLEHPHVVTLGRNASLENVLVPRTELAQRGVEIHECGRGGDVTYHGPGQLVGYPVMLLPEGRRGVKEYVRDLEESLIRALAHFGIDGGRDPGYPGVWVEGAKVAALGVRISRWVTTHGFALNVTTDLTYYRLITPCGIRDRGVTTMAMLLGEPPDMSEVKRVVSASFAEVFG